MTRRNRRICIFLSYKMTMQEWIFSEGEGGKFHRDHLSGLLTKERRRKMEKGYGEGGGRRQFNLSPVSTLLYRYGRRDVSRFYYIFFPSPTRPTNGLLEIGTMVSTFSNATAVIMPAYFRFVSSFDFNNFVFPFFRC